VEEVVFELMSWREGFFSFEEQPTVEPPAEANIRISTESLLMEGARRIDEWSRIEAKVPNLEVVPTLAEIADDHPGLLDLLPREWEVLSEIDGTKNLRAIAQAIAHSEFDVARVVYGLVSTGIVVLASRAASREPVAAGVAQTPVLEPARAALRAGDAEHALAAAEAVVRADPASIEARLVMARAFMKLGRPGDAADALRDALSGEALHAELHRELGFSAAWRGDFLSAVGSWERYLRMEPEAGDAARVRDAVDAATRLRTLLQEHLDV
jgi:tetratricopeptide (TPR) repeat protein